jgi:multiple sugar transport system ATP-binding protein
MAKVELKNVSKKFEDVIAVKDINLTVRQGEFLVLVGPSGCGKSTTLRLVAGLEKCSAGEIYIGDTIVNDIPPKDRDISMVFQNYALYPHMTVYDNLAFGLKMRKYSTEKIDERVKNAAEILQINSLMDRKPKQLSGGQQQRVALGRAIVRDPNVFLFDEPLSNLDAKLRVSMRTEIKKIHKKIQTTVVYVTHDQTEAMTLGDRIAVMKDGIIHQLNSPIEVYNAPADKFVAGFIGSPAMNFFDVKPEEEQLIFKNKKLSLPIIDKYKDILKKINKEVVLGIRPEDLYIKQKGKNYFPMEVDLEVVETMGDEIIIYLKAGQDSIVCKTTEYYPELENKKSLTIFINMDKAHFFDIDSGKALT